MLGMDKERRYLDISLRERMLQRTVFSENLQYLPGEGWLHSTFSVLRAGRAVTSADHRIERSVFRGQDILFCTAGRGFVSSRGATYSVEPGQLAWLANEEPHAHWPDASNPWTVLFVRIDGPDCPSFRGNILGDSQATVTLASPGELEVWFGRLFEALHVRDHLIDVTLNRLVAELSEIIFKAARSSDERRIPRDLEDLLRAIKASPGANWSATTICKTLNLSAAQTRRLFQAHLNASPKTWIIRERIQKAQRLLLETRRPIGLIAEDCGFYDIFHFSREFKRRVGSTPTAWRKAEVWGGIPDQHENVVGSPEA